ncbi:MAG: hypothetical protein KKD39_00040 [Candidatus Altiarchaeota archaeon]|nr:hypothetical protein [Candidatus Altiarchaeota archaeon]
MQLFKAKKELAEVQEPDKELAGVEGGRLRNFGRRFLGLGMGAKILTSISIGIALQPMMMSEARAAEGHMGGSQYGLPTEKVTKVDEIQRHLEMRRKELDRRKAARLERINNGRMGRDEQTAEREGWFRNQHHKSRAEQATEREGWFRDYRKSFEGRTTQSDDVNADEKGGESKSSGYIKLPDGRFLDIKSGKKLSTKPNT